MGASVEAQGLAAGLGHHAAAAAADGALARDRREAFGVGRAATPHRRARHLKRDQPLEDLREEGLRVGGAPRGLLPAQAEDVRGLRDKVLNVSGATFDALVCQLGQTRPRVDEIIVEVEEVQRGAFGLLQGRRKDSRLQRRERHLKLRGMSVSGAFFTLSRP